MALTKWDFMKWKDIQKEIKDKYPDFKELSWFVRFKLRVFENPITCVESFNEGTSNYSQTYKVYSYNGKKYFYKFGW